MSIAVTDPRLNRLAGVDGSLSSVDSAQVGHQLTAIAKTLTIAEQIGAPVWLRGGWAMDFYLGRVTRGHADIDWFALKSDGRRLAAALVALGYQDVTTAAADQQVDLVKDGIEHGIGLIELNQGGEPLVGGGPFAGEPWPADMLDGPVGHIAGIRARVIAPTAQIELKQMMPTWNPRLRRRRKDLDDIEAIQMKLRAST